MHPQILQADTEDNLVQQNFQIITTMFHHQINLQILENIIAKELESQYQEDHFQPNLSIYTTGKINLKGKNYRKIWL